MHFGAGAGGGRRRSSRSGDVGTSAGLPESGLFSLSLRSMSKPSGIGGVLSKERDEGGEYGALSGIGGVQEVLSWIGGVRENAPGIGGVHGVGMVGVSGALSGIGGVRGAFSGSCVYCGAGSGRGGVCVMNGSAAFSDRVGVPSQDGD